MAFGFRVKRGEATETTPVDSTGVSADGDGVARATGVDDEVFTVEAGVDQLKKFKNTHQWDYNLDYDQIETVNKVLESDDLEKTANLEHTLLEEDSPYFEVRASVRNYDE